MTQETERHAFFFLYNEAVAAKKHDGRVQLTRAEVIELRQVRIIDSEREKIRGNASRCAPLTTRASASSSASAQTGHS